LCSFRRASRLSGSRIFQLPSSRGGEPAGIVAAGQPAPPGSAAARLQTERATQADTDYGAVGANASSPQRLITDPAVTNLVASSPALQREITEARNIVPGFANLPDNDMRLLHAAYQGIGQKVGGALNPDNRYAYGLLHDQLGTALSNANPDYATAVGNYAANSAKLDALRDGTGFLDGNAPPSAQTLAGFAGKPNADELAQLYRTGALDRISDTIDRAGLGGDESRRLFTSQDRLDQLRPLFGPQGDPAADAKFAAFRQQGRDEGTMFDNYRALRAGQFQAPAPPPSERPGMLSALTGATAGLLTGEHALGALKLGELASLLSQPHMTMSPEVRQAAGRMLFSTDPATRTRALSAMAAPPGARWRRGWRHRSATAPGWSPPRSPAPGGSGTKAGDDDGGEHAAGTVF
jgi:hypothetical protein